MSDTEAAEVRYVGLHQGELLVRMPDDTMRPHQVKDTLKTTAAHAKALVESGSWEPVKKGGGK